MNCEKPHNWLEGLNEKSNSRPSLYLLIPLWRRFGVLPDQDSHLHRDAMGMQRCSPSFPCRSCQHPLLRSMCDRKEWSRTYLSLSYRRWSTQCFAGVSNSLGWTRVGSCDLIRIRRGLVFHASWVDRRCRSSTD